ncbi:MAG: ParB N-terminal domain-containing protein [Proteobacteria bacterium]|jgi:hypothetical protein|nr:ParB N-terminal domain-containing protein [Pseudomonadota bacterium]
MIEITKVNINELVPADYNPRDLLGSEYLQLKNSMRKFGFKDPVIANSNENRKNIIISGHQRLKVARDLGIHEVPVVYVNIENMEDEREFNIRLNKNTGHFVNEKLSEFDRDFLAGIGFDPEELDEIFKNLGSASEESVEIEFTPALMEENNYVLLYFNDEFDWNVAKAHFQIKTVKSLDSRKGYERKGVGRVIDGKEYLNRIGVKTEDINENA